MDLDEWSIEQYDEWEVPAFQTYSGNSQTEPQSPQSPSLGVVKQGPFPEVELGSSSDEDAPPAPQTTQLARENLKLRSIMNDLKQQKQTADNTNMQLKNELSKFRNVFKTQMKSSIFSFFK